MPSPLHTNLLELFTNRPELALELLRDALQIELPAYSTVQISSADLTEAQPTEYRADLVLQLAHDKPVLGVIVEVQLARDERKKYAWPVYVATLRARLKCPVQLLIVTANEAIARWAAKPISAGPGFLLVPQVVGPSGVPAVTDVAQAGADPELAVLSAIVHGQDIDIDKAARVAHAAILALDALDAERQILYLDLIELSLSAAVRRELRNMNPRKREYLSDFARGYYFQGELRGEAQGRASLVVKQLAIRFGHLPDDVRARLEAASIADLDAIGERLLTAASLQEALGPPPPNDN